MKILFSIIINALILLAIAFLLDGDSNRGIAPGVILGCIDCGYLSAEAWKTYIIGGIILGIINVVIRPILNIVTIPLFFLFFGLVVFFVNFLILRLFDYIVNQILLMPGVAYHINGTINFIIAVAIFTVLNIIYSLLFSKR